MCICIPPSKTQRRHNPNARHIIHTRMVGLASHKRRRSVQKYTLAWVLVNLLATCDLS